MLHLFFPLPRGDAVPDCHQASQGWWLSETVSFDIPTSTDVCERRTVRACYKGAGPYLIRKLSL